MGVWTGDSRPHPLFAPAVGCSPAAGYGGEPFEGVLLRAVPAGTLRHALDRLPEACRDRWSPVVHSGESFAVDGRLGSATHDGGRPQSAGESAEVHPRDHLRLGRLVTRSRSAPLSGSTAARRQIAARLHLTAEAAAAGRSLGRRMQSRGAARDGTGGQGTASGRGGTGRDGRAGDGDGTGRQACGRGQWNGQREGASAARTRPPEAGLVGRRRRLTLRPSSRIVRRGSLSVATAADSPAMASFSPGQR